MTQTTEYTAQDGLNVLGYLGITNITNREREVFREKWDGVYKGRRNLIGAIWTLYSEVLPFICGDGDRGSFVVAQLRDSDFDRRLQTTGLDEELIRGIPLEEILKKGPHQFVTRIVLD